MGSKVGLARKTCVAVVLTMTSMGCAHLDTEIFKDVPTYRVDTFASEVTWQRKNGEAVPSDSASVARVEIAEVLNEWMKDRADLTNGQPARFRARIVQTDSGRYDITFGFQAGDRFVATQVEAYSIKEGVHRAMFRGLHPESQAIPEFYKYDYRPLKMGLGISSAVMGAIPLTFGILVVAGGVAEIETCEYPPLDPSLPNCTYEKDYQNLETGIPLLLLGTAMVGAGIWLAVSGHRDPPPKGRKASAPRTFVRISPISSGFRMEF